MPFGFAIQLEFLCCEQLCQAIKKYQKDGDAHDNHIVADAAKGENLWEKAQDPYNFWENFKWTYKAEDYKKMHRIIKGTNDLKSRHQELGRWLSGLSVSQANMRTWVQIPSMRVKSQTWQHMPAIPMLGVKTRESQVAAGQPVLID